MPIALFGRDQCATLNGLTNFKPQRSISLTLQVTMVRHAAGDEIRVVNPNLGKVALLSPPIVQMWTKPLSQIGHLSAWMIAMGI